MNFKDSIMLMLVTSAVGSVAVAAPEELSRGHRILLERGLQLAPWTDVGNPATVTFDLDRWNESGFTTIDFLDRTHPHPDFHVPAGLPVDNSMPWSRVLGFIPGLTIALEPWELDFLPSLTRLQIGDEQQLGVQANLDTIKATIGEIHARYPNVIAHTGQAGTQVVDPATGNIRPEMRTMMSYAQPDMLMVNQYPYVNPPPTGGRPTWMYTVLEGVRQLGLEGNDGSGNDPIPTGITTQAFVDGATWNRPPSESEIRQQHFAAWAFGFKVAAPFVYDNIKANASVNPVIFSGDGTDSPTATFYHFAESNRESLNLGPALVRLISTDLRMKMGRHVTATGSAPNTLPQGIAAWDASADPYITGISAYNLGSKNAGLEGDVILGYFKPLDPSFTDPGFDNDLYFMIVNGLADANGSADETRQRIRIDFNLGTSGIDSLLRLNRDTGAVEVVPLVPQQTAGRHHLDVFLDGGTGDLFKYNNGAPFIIPEPSALAVFIGMSVATLKRPA